LLLDESDHDAAAIAEAFLRNSLALSETISSQVMQSLLKHLKVDRQILSKNQFNLLDNIMSKFITSCFQCKLMYAMNAAMSSNRNKSISNGSIHRSRTMDLDSLQLGDNVEILLSTEWLVGTVVKVNSMTGELHIEHSSSGDGGVNPPSLQVSIVHRSSGQVRSLTTSSSSSSSTLAAAAHRPEQSMMRRNVVTAVNDDHHIAAATPPLPTVHTGLGGLFPPPLEEDQQSHGNNEDLKDHAFNIKFGHNANNEIGERIMIDISLLLYGRYPYHCEGLDAKRGGRRGGVIASDMNAPHHMSTSIPMSIINNMGGHNDHDDEIPRCENGHICLVKPIISLNNIGFICACCTKLYSMTGTNQQQPNFGRQFPELAHLVQTRYAQATHRWNCEDCNYDLCLNCFPCKSFDHHHHHHADADAADAMFGLSSAASYKTSSSPNHSMKRYNFSYNYNNTNNNNNNKKDDDDDNAAKLKHQQHHHHNGTGQRHTICLIGRLESSYCIVRDAPSHDAREISRVSVNSVIDIIDTIDSEYYQLIGSKGYVRKVLGVGWYWRTLPRERYMVYNTTEKEEEEELESNSDDVPPPLDDIRLSKGDDHGYTREKASSNNNSSSSSSRSSSSRPSISSSVAGSNVSAEPTPDQSSVSYLFAMLLQNIISIDKARKNLFHVSYNSNSAVVVVDDDRQLKVQLKLSELRIEYMSLLKHALLLLAQVLIRCMLL